VGASSGGVERCLDLTDGNTADGTPLQLWTCNVTSDTMLWTFATDDNGKPRIINKRSGKCMDVRAGSTTPGAVIQNYHCASLTFGRPNLAQQWFAGPR
jgi:alpha-N-acetylglucosaminidase